MIVRYETDDGDSVSVDGDRITHSGLRADMVIPVGSGQFCPGLINAHDHLHRNHYGRLGSPPYADAYEWGRDIHERCADVIAAGRRLPREDALRFGALKNLCGAVTTVVHHDRHDPLLSDPAFPLRVPALRATHSLGFDDAERLRGGGVACIHLAEGTTRAAAAEVHTLAGMSLLHGELLAVHLTGIDKDGVALLGHAGTAAVWCPSSNAFLFGRGPAPWLFDGRVDVLLGTDSLLTGAGTLLDELRVARATGLLDEARLLDAVGATAARRLRLPVPSLAPGSAADFVLLRRPLPEAKAADVALVVVGGRVVLADESIGAADITDSAGVSAGGVGKRVPKQLADALERARAINPECAAFLDA